MSKNSRDKLDELSSLVGLEPDHGQRISALERNVQWRSVRVMAGGCGVVGLLLSVALVFIRNPAELMQGWLMPLLLLLVSGMSFMGLWKLPTRHGRAFVLAVLFSIIGVAVTAAFVRQLGLNAVGLGVLALMVAVATAMHGLRTGLAVLAVAALGLTVIAWGQLSGLIAPRAVRDPVPVMLVAHAMVLTIGLVVGLSTMRMVRRSVREANERNARFRHLLSMAADWYWEMDREFRFTHLAEDKPGSSGMDLDSRLGKAPWELESMGLSDEELDAHRADLESHRPFHGLVARRRGGDGNQRYVSISGEPRFDAEGNFRGYWGVGRDVTGEVQAEQTIQATETRYRELFRRSPSPLVLHRWGRVLDANPAAMAMFGYTQRSSMIGQDIFAHYEPGEDERARQRAAKIEAMPVGAMLPQAEFRLRTLSRRRRLVQVTTVRVDAIGGPATLSFFIDQTEASRAQEALRRSEALLSHLVATSPDVITLTEMSTGRYAMVNKTFEQLSGYTTEEVLGRSSDELGIWYDPADRARVIASVREHGRANELPVSFPHQERRAGVHGDVGGALRDGGPGLPGHQCPRRDRQRAHAPRAFGHPRERLHRHHTHA